MLKNSDVTLHVQEIFSGVFFEDFLKWNLPERVLYANLFLASMSIFKYIYIYICIGHKLLKKIASLNLFKLRYMAAAIEPGPAVVSNATEGICKICAAYPASCRLKNHEILPSQKIHEYQLKRNHFERYIPSRTSIFSGDVRRRLPGDLWLGVFIWGGPTWQLMDRCRWVVNLS